MASLYAQTQAIHNKLYRQFYRGLDTDIELAKELQDFLNWTVYNKGIQIKDEEGKLVNTVAWTEDSPTLLKGLLTNELKQQFTTGDNSIASLFQQTSFDKNNKVGEVGESAFAQAITQIILNGAKDLAQDFLEDNSLSTVAGTTIIGTKQATVTVPKAMQDMVQQKLTSINGKGNKYVRFALRSGKVDINTASLQALGEFTEAAQRLIGLTASVKNSKDFLIKLEQLNKKKAYFAIMSEMKKTSSEENEALYNYYFKTHSMQADDFIMAHINHISQIYALTGYGQRSYDEAGALILQRYARFLFYNNYQKQEIAIISTKDIVINQILKQGADNNRFQMRNSNKVKYYIEHRLTK